jgi:endoglycosylceramidase
VDRRSRLALPSALVLTAAILMATTVSAAAADATRLPSLSSGSFHGANVKTAAISGALRSPGGPYLYDSHGRVVFLHGVNAVYKFPPYELYADPGRPWNFSAADASLMARLAFNVVRLGMTWSGLEPGRAPANDPAVCDRGKPGNPHQFSQSVLNRYVAHLRTTVDLLARFHIYTVLDMHQDVYNEMFEGEGAPNWAVCTDGIPSVDPPGRWSLAYATPAADIALSHFWKNNVRGISKVSTTTSGATWPMPSDPTGGCSVSIPSTSPSRPPSSTSTASTSTGSSSASTRGGPMWVHPRTAPLHSGVRPPIPSRGLSRLSWPTIPRPSFSTNRTTSLRGATRPTWVRWTFGTSSTTSTSIAGRSPVTGNPTDLTACAAQDVHSIGVRQADRPLLTSPAQPRGPAWLVSEFGATTSAPLLANVTAQLDADKVGWIYWAWKYYGDPTGSSAESLVMADGRLRSTALVLSQTYPEAVAGIPTSFSFSPTTDVFDLSYVPNHRVHAPTVVFVPTSVHYQRGYCALTTGGRVVSPRGSDLLEVANRARASQVTVAVTPGRCGRVLPA